MSEYLFPVLYALRVTTSPAGTGESGAERRRTEAEVYEFSDSHGMNAGLGASLHTIVGRDAFVRFLAAGLGVWIQLG